MNADEIDLSAIKFDDRGLVPVIAQDADTGDVLMLAWMNDESLRRTLAEGRMVYWSRSRQELWRKGDTSGDTQTVREAFYDCDGDTLAVQGDPTRPRRLPHGRPQLLLHAPRRHELADPVTPLHLPSRDEFHTLAGSPHGRTGPG